MGFLGEMERRKQQQAQLELKLKADQERQRQVAFQENAEKNARHEEGSRKFIKDFSTITSLLVQLNQFGYTGYFEKVSEISGFKLQQCFYLANSEHEHFGASEEEEGAAEKLKVASSQLGWPWELMSPWGIEKNSSMAPNAAFFGDDLIDGIKREEFKNIGIGIKFSKNVEYDFWKGRKLKKSGYDSVLEEWDNVAYVRINPYGMAIITGYTQHQVDLRNMKLFDEVLENVIRNPSKSHKIIKTDYHFSTPEGCGPCLSGHSLIGTPDGFLIIKNLKNGDLVWSIDGFGNKVQSVIVKTNRRLVSRDHKMAHIALEDGRKLTVSPGHPTVDNKELGSLKNGQFLDGSRIASIRIEPYKEKYTYDILPSEETGGYWANNILIGSTLSPKFKRMQEKKFYTYCLSKQ